MKKFLSIAVVVVSFGVSKAQTPLYTDGLMMPRKDLGNGLFYTRDQWNKYWEGTRKQENGNLGTASSQSITWMGAYGVTEKLTVVATLPYVWTKTSGGTLAGMKGLQDLTVAAKYNFWNLKGDQGKSSLKFFGLLAFTLPTTNYTIDMGPNSIGMGSKNISYRLTGSYIYNSVWFATFSGAYTWRSNVFLDRPSYFDNNQIYFTNEIKMPNVFDFIVRAGYHKTVWRAEVYYTQQNTLGGSDIRRWVGPLSSKQFNYGKAGASIMYAAPKLKNIALRAWGNYTLMGRNVGESTTFTLGAMYFLHFAKNQ